jgi:hypothetical protein
MSQDRLRALLGLCITLSVVGCVDGSIQQTQNGAASVPGVNGGTSVMDTGTVADGSCRDTQSDPAHCGSCTHACATGQICASGLCQAASSTCTAPQTLCSGACVDLTGTANCGACGNACATGQSCSAGVCQCPGAQLACNGACIDTQTSNDNCGGCNQPCATGASCSAGKCGCAQGQQLCNGVCADLQQSTANCGACGQACATGQTCSSGACVTGAGADGCSGKALGITLSQIAVYQTVKIGVMNAGAEVAAAQRMTDVVAGRQTLFRLSVTVDGGFAARQLSGRVTVSNGTTATQYFGTQMVSKSSVDTDSTSTFQVYVPPEQITADTHYFAELVECGTGSGNAGTTRFPATGDIALGARQTGGVKVTIVPLLANNNLPDTSDTALTVYRQQMMAMYPIDSIELTVAAQMSIDFPVDWETTLDQMRSRRKTDNPADDVYYFGLLKPQDTFAQFCGNGCTTGIGYVAAANAPSFRAAMGIGFADRESAQTMAHEIGHNHGRNHAPCVPKGGTISGVDPNYPFPDGSTGVIGYDSRTKVLLPATGTDLMGYCSNVWLSEYTYGGITDRVALVNGNTVQALNTTPLRTWRVLLLGSKGPRWGIPITRPSLPEGNAVSANILDGKGALLTQTDVYRTEVSDTGSAVVMVPEPKAGWSAVQVPGFAALAF